ncbi:MAG: zinc-ribbon domain-containing protein [Parvularculaceae bacterium]|nr:zinc-ribbon domain-containing protein [Parvularculaceae bacterium]
MIITCPSCAARYDVDDDRFSPDGRSVRCAECAESWFVPAPTPVENLMPLKPKARKLDETTRPDPAPPRAARVRFDDAYEEEVDEPLFKTSPEKPVHADDPEAKAPPRANRAAPDDSDERETAPARNDDFLKRRAAKPGKVVDADFEDVEAAAPKDAAASGRGFGRRSDDEAPHRALRGERRDQTAVARYEDLDPIAERVFNDEFFAALRVQPKELERAIRKARRRAEAREKNRLTPMRALGWSGFAAVIIAAGVVGYAYRNNIVAMFPNALGAYQAIGIDASPNGLKIEGVTHRVAMSTQGPVIEILGRVRNAGADAAKAPLLQAEAVGAEGQILSRWTFSAQTSDINAVEVKPGETINFSTRTPAPEGVTEVLLSFAPAEGVKVSVGDLLKPAGPE